MSENREKQLPSGWRETQLGELLTVLRGVSYKKQDATAEPAPEKIPILRATNIDAKLNFDNLVYVPQEYVSEIQLLNPGDIVIAASSGSRHVVGKAAALTVPWVGSFGAFCYGLRPYLQETASYISLFLQTSTYRDYVSALSAGVNINNLRREHIEGVPLPVPPLNEQHRIVEEIERRFSQLDAGVAALERAKANLKSYRASMLQAACEGRLVPTEAELTRTEVREYEPADRLLTRILNERRATWEAKQLAKMEAQGKAPKDDKWKAKYKEPAGPDTSELPELPEGWVWATWEQLSTRVTVGHVGPMRHEYVQDGVPFLRSQNVRENRFDPTGLLYISPTFHKRLSKSTLHPGDLVVVRSGGVGVTCVIPESLGEANCSDLVIIQKPLGLNSQYGSFFMNSVAKRDVEAGQVGIALTHFNTRSVATLSVAVPPLVEQRRIVTEVEDRLSILDKLEAATIANLKRADRLRQAILKQAFEGKLVPQDPNDEPASILLERIREERARKAEEEKVKRKPARKKMAKTKRAASKRGKQAERQPLLGVLNSAADRLTPEQLFNQSGYTPEDIEEFYEELKREVSAQRIEQERPNDTDVYLRAVDE